MVCVNRIEQEGVVYEKVEEGKICYVVKDAYGCGGTK